MKVGRKESLENLFIEKAKWLYKRQWEEKLYHEIECIIHKISFDVLTASKMPLDEKQEEGRYSDITHFIPSNFKNDPRLDSLINDFVQEKIKSLNKQTREKTIKILEIDTVDKPKTLTDIVNEIKKYTLQIQHFNSILKKHKKDLAWLLNIINPTSLSVIVEIFDSIRQDYNSDVIVINDCIQKILFSSTSIKSQQDKVNQTPDLYDNIYNEQWEFLFTIEIEKIKWIISEMNQIISTLEEKISDEERKIVANDIIDSQETTSEETSKEEIDDFTFISNDPILKWFIEDILSIEWIISELVSSAIKELYRWTKDIIWDVSTSDDDKNKQLIKALNHIDLWFLNNNNKAFYLFKKIASFIITKSKDQFNLVSWPQEKHQTEEKSTIVFLMPKKNQKEIIEILKTIVEYYLINREQSEKSKIKTICENYIIELNNLRTNIRLSITENQDKEEFFIYNVIPIIEKLWFPQKYYELLKRIAYFFYIEERENLFKLALLNINQNIKMTLSLKDIENAISNSILSPSIQKTCKNCLNYLIHNLPSKIIQNIIIEQEKLTEKTNSSDINANIKAIVRKAHNYLLDRNSSSSEPVDEILKEAQTVKESRASMHIWWQTELSSTPINQELFNQVIDNYLKQYTSIPPHIKAKIKIFAETYYFNIKSVIENSKKEVNTLFSDN